MEARFCDDLLEVILNFLPLKEKIKFESISKQWKELLFSKQTVLVINGNEKKSNILNSLNQIFVKKFSFRHFTCKEVIHLKAFESVLKMCPFIQRIDFDFCSIDKKVMKIIEKNCKHLKEIHFNENSIIDFKEDVLLGFGQTLGSKLVKLSLSSKNFEKDFDYILVKKFLNFCPNLKSLKVYEMKAIIDGNKQFLSKLESISTYFLSNSRKDFKSVINRYQKKLKKIELFLGKKLIINISNRNGVNIDGNKIDMKSLIHYFNELVLKCPNIEVLKLSASQIVSTRELFECIPHFKKFKSLSLTALFVIKDNEFNGFSFGQLEL
jgi:hypothetical protein